MNAAVPRPRPLGAHLPGLDGLRGIAIIAVLLHHLVTPDYPSGLPTGLHGIVVKGFYRICDVGWSGVDLFFVLSGFLITGILIDARGREHRFRNFYARRCLRIFPLYYGVLLVLFVVLPLLAAVPMLHGALVSSAQYAFLQSLAPNQAWLWTYSMNIKTVIDPNGWKAFGYLGHFWSLSVEEHFYLLWPLVVFHCDVRTVSRVGLAIAGFSVFARIALLGAGMAPINVYMATPCRLDGLAMGSVVAAWVRMSDGWETIIPWAARTLKYLGLPTLAALLTLARFRFHPVMLVTIHALLSVSCAAALPFAALAHENLPRLHTWLCSPFLRTFGKYSYGIYVLHPFVVPQIDAFAQSAGLHRILGTSYESYAITRTLLGICGAFVLAYLSWHLFEKHFLRLKVLFPSGDVPAPPEITLEKSPAGAEAVLLGSAVLDRAAGIPLSEN